ncbi:MAG: hypothetical protein LBC52_06295 [Treponema sp.]|jgi:hypothetical protein|nr:hypothetical protein [Treponema sp.]
MKSKKILLGILAIALVFTMMVVGCDNGSTDNNVPTTQSVTYQSAGSDGSTYILTITKSTARYAVKEGDSYVLTIKKSGQPDKVSKGIVSEVGDDGALTLQPNNSGSETFTVTVNDSGQMEEIKGTITVGYEEGTPVTAPGIVTPQENNNGGNPEIDTNALNAEILKAELARDGVKTASDASEVPRGKKWVTQNEWDAFDNVYKEAAEIKTYPSNQSDVDTAKTNLQTAITTFNAAKKDGSADVIKLSGTITVKNKGQIVPYIVIQAHNGDWTWLETTRVHLTGENTPWEIIVKPFSSSTEISYSIVSYDNDKYENKLFETTVVGLKTQVYNENVDNININMDLNLITISGTLKLGNNWQTIQSIVIQVYKKGDYENIIGTVDIVNAVNNIPWSIMIPSQAADTGITFSVVGFAGPIVWAYAQLFAFWHQDFGVTVGNQDKSGIVIPLNIITIGGTLNIDYNGQTIPSVFINIQRENNDDIYITLYNVKGNTSWSTIIPSQDVETDAIFHVVGFSTPEPSWEDDSLKLFGLYNKDFGVKIGNQNKTNIALNLITISGTVSVTYNGNRVPSVSIGIHIKDGDEYGEWIADTLLPFKNPPPNTPWSIVIPAFPSDKETNINILGEDEYGNFLFWNDTPKTVKNTNVSGIELNLEIITD